jgi:hypothetical protein
VVTVEAEAAQPAQMRMNDRTAQETTCVPRTLLDASRNGGERFGSEETNSTGQADDAVIERGEKG